MTRLKNWPKAIVETLINLPLVLPPTVIGFYLLITFSPNSFLGALLKNTLGIELMFSFTGLVLASIIYSLPFMIQPIYTSIENLPLNIKYASYSLGKTPFQTFLKVLLPSVKPSIYSAIMISFAHILGEFGIVMMIGGNIPDQTRLASIALFDEVESLNYATAHIYALLLLGISFILMFSSNLLIKGYFKNRI